MDDFWVIMDDFWVIMDEFLVSLGDFLVSLGDFFANCLQTEPQTDIVTTKACYSQAKIFQSHITTTEGFNDLNSEVNYFSRLLQKFKNYTWSKLDLNHLLLP